MQMQQRAGSSVGRRGFLRQAAWSGMGLAGASMIATRLGAFDEVNAARRLGLGTGTVRAASLTTQDVQLLQFILNIEYFQAEFYSFAVTGLSLEANGIAVDGAVGTLGPTVGGAQVLFDDLPSMGPMQQIAAQMMRDEINHVQLIRAVLGPENTIAKPALSLSFLGPVGHIGPFLRIARDAAIVAISAYGYAMGQLDESLIQGAGQVAMVEGLHAGTLQTLCLMNNLAVPPIDKLDVIAPPGGPNFFDDTLDKGMAILRTPEEILQLGFLNGATGTNEGAFFPFGFNGAITTV